MLVEVSKVDYQNKLLSALLCGVTVKHPVGTVATWKAPVVGLVKKTVLVS